MGLAQGALDRFDPCDPESYLPHSIFFILPKLNVFGSFRNTGLSVQLRQFRLFFKKGYIMKKIKNFILRKQIYIAALLVILAIITAMLRGKVDGVATGIFLIPMIYLGIKWYTEAIRRM